MARRKRDTGRFRANFRVRVLAASPEGTLSIRVAKEIPQLYRQYPVDTSVGNGRGPRGRVEYVGGIMRD